MCARTKNFDGRKSVLLNLREKIRRQFSGDRKIGREDSLHASSPGVLTRLRCLVSHGRTLVAGICRPETFSSRNVNSNGVHKSYMANFARRMSNRFKRPLN